MSTKMNKIRFRAKPINKKEFGEWVEGFYMEDLHHGRMKSFIFNCPLYIEVDPATTGQFIGIEDKTGRKAFAGDIFKDNFGTIRTIFQAPGGFATEDNPVAFGYGYQGGINPLSSMSDLQTVSWFKGNCEIIGNIYDSPSLLK